MFQEKTSLIIMLVDLEEREVNKNPRKLSILFGDLQECRPRSDEGLIEFEACLTVMQLDETMVLNDFLQYFLANQSKI